MSNRKGNQQVDDDDDDDDDRRPRLKWPVSLFIEQGKLFFRKGWYRKAIETYDTMLSVSPTNVQLLVAKAQAYLRLLDYDKANEFFEAALKINPECAEALYQRGEVQYIAGDYELAYVTFQRGYKKCPIYRKFQTGMNKCEHAILSAIGPKSNLKISFADVENMELLMQSKREKAEEKRGKGKLTREQDKGFFNKKEQEEKVEVEKEEETEEVKEKITRESIKRERAKTKHALGAVNEDFEFLKGLSRSGFLQYELRFLCDDRISEHRDEALTLLEGRKSFWQMKKPLPTVKNIRSVLRKEPSKELWPTSDMMIGLVTEGINSRLRKSVRFLKKDPQKVVDVCKTVVEMLERASGSRWNEEDRLTLMIRTLDTLGCAYAEIGELELAIAMHDKQWEIAPNDDVKYNAGVNLATDYVASDQHDHAVDVLRELYALTLDDPESGYVATALCDCEIAAGRYDEARETAKRALLLARRINDLDLEADAMILTGEIELHSGNKDEAVKCFDIALSLAIVNQNLKVQKEMKNALWKFGNIDTDKE